MKMKQPETGFSVEAYDMLPCLTEIDAMVRTAWEPGIRFELDVAPRMPELTWCRESLQGALMNLLSNARDAMPSGGTVSLVVSLHRGESTAPGIEIRITDSGLGMNSETLRHAADPFFTTKVSGMGGLGLPMVMRFVQETGGSLQIESEPGAGTIVTLLLPISAKVPH